MKTIKKNRNKYRRNKKGGGGSGVKTKKNIKNKKTNTLEEFKQVKCSPASLLDKEGEKNAFTCYNDETLLKIRELWNSRHPDSKIDSKESYDIWKNVKNNMQDVCSNESCWIKQIVNDNKVNKEIISYTFAPTSPKEWKKNPNEWLSSIDIVKVMKQYEKAYTCFEFIGPSPIDFDSRMMYNECVWPELCKFEIEKYIKKVRIKSVLFSILIRIIKMDRIGFRSLLISANGLYSILIVMAMIRRQKL